MRRIVENCLCTTILMTSVTMFTGRGQYSQEIAEETSDHDDFDTHRLNSDSVQIQDHVTDRYLSLR